MMAKKEPVIIVVSDATGETAENITRAAVLQFGDAEVDFIKKAKVRTPTQARDALFLAKRNGALLVYTIVSEEIRGVIEKEAKQLNVLAVDLIGPLLRNLEMFFNKKPISTPGLLHQLTEEYFLRNEAVNFTVKHDDGLGLATLHESDIVILGVSRTSKTPLSIYLAHKGYKVANIPVVLGIDLPEEIENVDNGKIIGLVCSVIKLQSTRIARLKSLSEKHSETYAGMEYIQEELSHCKRLFSKIPGIPILDITNMAVEETASEIIKLIYGK